MAPVAFFEVLDGRDHVVQRMSVEEFPVSLGRAYTNQLIIDDPYVCPTHAVIDRDEQGVIRVRDLGSVNGLYEGNGRKRVDSFVLTSGDRFRIGHTAIRYCEVVQAVAPTLYDRAERWQFLASPVTALGCGVLFFLAAVMDNWLGSIERVGVADLIGEPLLTLVSVGAWAGLWSLVSRLVSARFHFLAHFSIASLAMLAFSSLTQAAEWSEFLWPALPILWSAGIFGVAVILAIQFFGHLRYASTLKIRLRLYAALAVVVLVVGLSLVFDRANRNKFSTVMGFNGILKPVPAAWIPAGTIEQFSAQNSLMKIELDQLAERAQAENP